MPRAQIARRSHRTPSPRRRTTSAGTQRTRPTTSARPVAGRSRASSRKTTGARFVERREAMAGHDPGIEAFLERFTKAITAGDGASAAACFEYPSLMVMAGDQGANQPLADARSVAAFFDQAPQQYEAIGIATTFPDVLDVDWVAPDLAMVRTRFPYIDGDGNDTGDAETSIYFIRRRDGAHAITCAITLGTDSQRNTSRRADR